MALTNPIPLYAAPPYGGVIAAYLAACKQQAAAAKANNGTPVKPEFVDNEKEFQSNDIQAPKP